MKNTLENAGAILAGATLSQGCHNNFQDGVCAMELVAHIAGEAHTDRPVCACPVITGFVIGWNDGLKDNQSRDKWIKPLVPSIVGSRVFGSDGKMDEDVIIRRVSLIVDAGLRRVVPLAFEAAARLLAIGGIPDHAAKMNKMAESMRTMEPITRVPGSQIENAEKYAEYADELATLTQKMGLPVYVATLHVPQVAEHFIELYSRTQSVEWLDEWSGLSDCVYTATHDSDGDEINEICVTLVRDLLAVKGK